MKMPEIMSTPPKFLSQMGVLPLVAFARSEIFN